MDYGKEGFVFKKIVIRGLVQGIGFRPYVARVARALGISGRVYNANGIVEVRVWTDWERLDALLNEFDHCTLPYAAIDSIEVLDLDEWVAVEGFSIVESVAEFDQDNVILPTDLPVCDLCLAEMHDLANRRFNHGYISCVSCGPRYTIMKALPYDRETTVMEDFEMCPLCRAEYVSDDSRRYHAQTVSCKECGPVHLFAKEDLVLVEEQAFEAAVAALKEKQVVAVKGIGGYHLVCSPYDPEPVRRLMAIKNRDQKPFAVMFPNVDEIKAVCFVSEPEERELRSQAAPIVLLKWKNDIFDYEVTKGSLYCGCFLPYTPLQHELVERLGALIFTSANLSDSPILIDDHEMQVFARDNGIGVLYNTRRILRHVDDSVLKMINGQVSLIRRARGFVPLPIGLKETSEKNILAMGSDLKNTFCFLRGKQAYVSQYMGDLGNLAANDSYADQIRDWFDLFSFQPDVVVCDKHPRYFSTTMGESFGMPVLKVQHHHAHIASVLAEQHLDGSVIGIAFDGTGFGEDGAVWGCEFLVCEREKYKRVGHLRYVKMLGGDKASRDADKMVACYLHSFGMDFLNDRKENEWIRAGLEHNVNTVLTSSMGRLFDAVAAVLDICHENRYESECAVLLEKAAEDALDLGIAPVEMTFGIDMDEDMIIVDHEPVFACLVEKRFDDGRALALGFHWAVARMIRDVCLLLRRQYGIDRVAASGGVFQNAVLVGLFSELLSESGFSVYLNRELPPNDGCISVGQGYIASLL